LNKIFTIVPIIASLVLALFTGVAHADKCPEPDKAAKNNAGQYTAHITIVKNGIVDSEFTITTLADGRKATAATGSTIRYLDSSLLTVVPGGVTNESSHYKDLTTGTTTWVSLERRDRTDDRHLNLEFGMVTSKLLSMKDVRVGDRIIQLPTIESSHAESNLVVTLDEGIAITNDVNGHHKGILIKVSKVN
jgi:hypothetical protein